MSLNINNKMCDPFVKKDDCYPIFLLHSHCSLVFTTFNGISMELFTFEYVEIWQVLACYVDQKR
jgi:hypothetical protein